MENPNLSFAFVQKQLKNPPHWSEDVLLAWHDAYPRDCHAFVTKHYWSDEASVNVFNVVGTDHWDYQDKTWLSFLQGGKRMVHNLQKLEDNPDYYLNLSSRHPRIHYYTTDGLQYYVGSDGNHRTCLARFFLFEQAQAYLHRVTVDHFQVDWLFYDLYKRFRQLIIAQQLPYELTATTKTIGREDTAGWKTDLFEPRVILYNRKLVTEDILDYKQLLEKMLAIQTTQVKQGGIKVTFWRRFFS